LGSFDSSLPDDFQKPLSCSFKPRISSKFHGAKGAWENADTGTKLTSAMTNSPENVTSNLIQPDNFDTSSFFTPTEGRTNRIKEYTATNFSGVMSNSAKQLKAGVCREQKTGIYYTNLGR